MRFLFLRIAAFMALLLFTYLGKGQSPISIGILNEATAMPFSTFYSTPVHPGIQAGTETEWKENNRIRLYPMINIGYMFHKNLFQGLYLNGALGMDLKIKYGLNLKTNIGVGYLHTFSTQQEYQFKNGKYISKNDLGNPRLMPSISLGFGYHLKRESSTSTEIFMLYQNWIEYPYSPGFIPLMAHYNLLVGTKFYPFKEEKTK